MGKTRLIEFHIKEFRRWDKTLRLLECEINNGHIPDDTTLLRNVLRHRTQVLHSLFATLPDELRGNITVETSEGGVFAHMITGRVYIEDSPMYTGRDEDVFAVISEDGEIAPLRFNEVEFPFLELGRITVRMALLGREVKGLVRPLVSEVRRMLERRDERNE